LVEAIVLGRRGEKFDLVEAIQWERGDNFGKEWSSSSSLSSSKAIVLVRGDSFDLMETIALRWGGNFDLVEAIVLEREGNFGVVEEIVKGSSSSSLSSSK